MAVPVRSGSGERPLARFQPSYCVLTWLKDSWPLVYACMLSHFCCVQLFANPWTIARQAPLSMGFSRQGHWSGLPCPPPGNLPNPGTEPVSLLSPVLAGRFFTTWATWEAPCPLIRALIPFVWIPPSWSIHPPKTPPPNTITLGIMTMTSGGHLAALRSTFMGTVRTEALAVRHYQCLSSGDPESCCPSGPSPLLHLYILFPGCILSESTWVHRPCVYSQIQGVAKGSSLQRDCRHSPKACACCSWLARWWGLEAGPDWLSHGTQIPRQYLRTCTQEFWILTWQPR